MTLEKQHKKVILIGDGAVGSSYAFALVNQGIAQELGIIEIPQLFEKAVGDAEDLSGLLPKRGSICHQLFQKSYQLSIYLLQSCDFYLFNK